MLAAVPVAVPLAGAALAALTQLLGFCVAFGLLYVYRRTLSAIFVGFADWLDGHAISVSRFTVRPFGAIAGALRRVDRAVTVALEDWVRGSEIAIAFLWDQMGRQIDLLTQWTADFGNTVAGTFSTVTRQTIPNAERRAIEFVTHRTGALTSRVAEITSVALPGMNADILGLRGRVGTLRDTLRGVRSRVDAHAKLLAPAGFAALTMIAIRRMGLGWLRCGNVRRFGRSLCGLDPSILDAALLAGLVLGGTVSIERLTRELLNQSDEVERALRAGFVELRTLPRA